MNDTKHATSYTFLKLLTFFEWCIKVSKTSHHLIDVIKNNYEIKPNVLSKLYKKYKF